MTVYFDSWALEAKFDGTSWVDITADTVGGISCEYGIFGNGPLDRVGGVGTLTFALKNSTLNSAGLLGYYSPGHINCRSGFAPGLEVRIVFTLDLVPIQKWIGMIPTDGINVTPGLYKERTTSVTVKDWMHQCEIHPLNGFGYATNKTIMEAVALVLLNMPVQPPGTPDYRTGESTFSYVGDTITSKTTALAEFGKMAQSELGYFYLTRNGPRVEGRLTRNEEKIYYDAFPMSREDLGLLINEDGDFPVNEDGDGLLLSDSVGAFFDNQQISMTPSFGANFYNSAKFTAYPRRIDANPTTILFNLQSPMAIGAVGTAEATATISGGYKDPTGVAKSVSAVVTPPTSPVPPVATTHYKMFANKDGSGGTLTPNLAVSAAFGTGDFKYTFTNSGPAGYITFCTVVGKGVYTDIPAEYYLEDSDSITKHGDYPLTVTMMYQDDPMVAARWAQISLYQYKNLVTSIDDITYYANKSNDFLNAFLYLEPGNRIKIKEDVTGVYGDFFIHSVKFNIQPGNLVDFTWGLRACGLDVFHYVKWTPDTTPVALYGTWDDLIYGWDF